MKNIGSKAKIAKHILPIILKNRKEGQWYVEPFAGGMNTIHLVDGNRIASDVNYYLIEMWKKLIEGWVPEYITREQYYNIKKNKEGFPPYLVGWVGFNCSYGGKWFGGYAGEIKTPQGKIRNLQEEAVRYTGKQIPGLKGTTLLSCSFEQLDIPPESIVYCDPPYQGTLGYLHKIDHAFFWEWVRNLSKSGHSVFVSEYAAPDDFVCVWEKQISSTFATNHVYRKSKQSIERLFVYGGVERGLRKNG